MKNVILIILPFLLLISCTSNKQGKNLNIQNAKSAYTKFINLDNDLSYDEYKSLVTLYGKNSEYPDINK